MRKFIIWLSIFLGILIGSSLLSGAGIMFDNWYKFPKNFSCFIIMLIVYYFFVSLGLKITKKTPPSNTPPSA